MNYLERERERMEEKRQRIEERKKLMASTTTATKSVDKPEDTKGSKVTTKKNDSPKAMPSQMKGLDNKEELRQPQLKIEVHATATHHEAERQLEPKVAHSQSHDFSHGQAVSFCLIYFIDLSYIVEIQVGYHIHQKNII